MSQSIPSPHQRASMPLSSGAEVRTSTLPPKIRFTFVQNTNQGGIMSRYKMTEFINRHAQILPSKCGLCQQQQTYQELQSIGDCMHRFCASCLQKYCIYKIDVMEDVTCPEEGCEQLLRLDSPIHKRLPESSKAKLKKNMLWKQTISNPNLRLCPSEHCQGIIDLSHGFKCRECGVTFCKECYLSRHEGACDKNFQANFKDWKRCPRCRLFIERTEGCNHMTCHCGHQFCYVCLSDWDDDRHYRCGQLTNNIFNMQPNEIPRWKRLLVGLLMILAVPLLLVAILVSIVITLGLSVVVGVLFGPCILYEQCPECQSIWWCFLCPLLMVVGALYALLGAIVTLSHTASGVLYIYLYVIYQLLCFRQDLDENNQLQINQPL